MQIKAVRKWFTETSTISEVYINDKFLYYFLEDVARAEGVKIYGKTAIPHGAYEVVMDYSEKFKKLLPHVLNVPMFTGIRIHAGNKAEDTDGCLIIGLTREVDWVGNSRKALNSFILLLEAAITRGEVCTLSVVNKQEFDAKLLYGNV
jgi:hypothetical protein